MPFRFLHKTFGLTRKEMPIIVFVLFVMGIFGSGFLRPPINYEFLIYMSIIVAFLVALLITNKRVKYPTAVLWLLAICSCMHLAGGSIMIGDTVLYYHVVFPLFQLAEGNEVIRYDHVMHTVGIFTFTLLAYALVRHRITRKNIGAGMAMIIILSGMGFGALNEVLEFIISQTIENHGVGGYVNTGLDLIANLVGSVLAVIFIKVFLEKGSGKEKNEK